MKRFVNLNFVWKKCTEKLCNNKIKIGFGLKSIAIFDVFERRLTNIFALHFSFIMSAFAVCVCNVYL